MIGWWLRTKNILIIRLSSIGDVIHCSPVARNLKLIWPDCKLSWLVGEVCADLVKYNPYIDEVIVWSREKFDQNIRKFNLGEVFGSLRKLKIELSERSFDAVLDIHGLFLTGLIARMVKTELRIGLKGAKELNSLFMTKTAGPVGRRITEKYLGVLRPLGIVSVDERPVLVLPYEARLFAASLLCSKAIDCGEKIAVLIPGTTWQSKNWPAEYFAVAARSLYQDFTIILCGGKAEVKLSRHIEAIAGVPLINTVGKTRLLEMAAIIEKASVVITGDTGPLYIAEALGTPAVAVFGPTDPAIYAPRGAKNIGLSARQSCSFCHKMTCPKGEAVCMSAVAPAQVVRAAYEVAGLRPNRPPDKAVRRRYNYLSREKVYK